MNRYGRFLMLGFRGELDNSSGLSAAAKGMKEMIFRLGRRDIYKLLFDLLTFDLFFVFVFLANVILQASCGERTSCHSSPRCRTAIRTCIFTAKCGSRTSSGAATQFRTGAAGMLSFQFISFLLFNFLTLFNFQRFILLLFFSGAMIQISADILRTYAASDWPDGMSTAFGYVSSGGDLPFCSRVCVHVARGSFLYFSLSLFFSLFSSSLFSLHRYDWSKTHDDDGTELGGTCGTIAGPWLVTIELAMHEVSLRDLWRVAVFFLFI